MLLWFRKVVALSLIVSIGGLAVPLPAMAGMLPTDAATSSPDRERVAAFLDRAAVRAQMEALGVNPADVKSRVAALSDQEVANLAGQIDSAPAGADGGTVLGVLLLIAVVLLITDWLGYTSVYPFMKK